MTVRNPARRGNAGFSLVELIIVIAIMAVLVAVLAPNYISYVNRSRLQVDASNFAAAERMLTIIQTTGKIEAEGGVVIELEDIVQYEVFYVTDAGTLVQYHYAAGVPENACRARGDGEGHTKGQYLRIVFYKLPGDVVPSVQQLEWSNN